MTTPKQSCVEEGRLLVLKSYCSILPTAAMQCKLLAHPHTKAIQWSRAEAGSAFAAALHGRPTAELLAGTPQVF